MPSNSRPCIRFIVTPEINGRPDEYTVSILTGGGSCNYFIRVQDGQVTYRTQFQGERERFINTEEGHTLSGPWKSLSHLASELIELGVHPLRWPLAPLEPRAKSAKHAVPWPQCDSCYTRYDPASSHPCK